MPTPTETLFDRLINAASGPYELWDRGQPGFGLRISAPTTRSPKGRKTWQVMYRVAGGSKQRLKFGNFPEIKLVVAHDFESTLVLGRSGRRAAFSINISGDG